MSWIDAGIVLAYIAGCMALGAWFGSGAKARAGGLKGYFLGESDLPAWAVMISIVATETSAVTFLSVPGIAFKGNLNYLQLPLGYILARFVVARLLMPAYFQGEIFTAYQVLEKRFGGATQRAASVLFLVTRNLGAGLRLLLAARVLEQITGWDVRLAVAAIAAVTVAYTYIGGIKAVVWTDVIQFVIYLIAAGIAVAIIGRNVAGGWESIGRRAEMVGKFRVFDFTWDLASPYTFWAGVIGGLVLDTGTHGADQMMVQRYLSARSEKQASGALIASGFVILAQFALFLIIGVGLYVLYQDHPPGRALLPDQLFSYFIIHYLPTGVLGLVIAAIFSVTMSTLSGSLSASASSTVTDLYRPLRPNASESHLLALSKGLTAFWGVVQVAVALGMMSSTESVVNNALAVASFVTGILLGVFLLGLLTTTVGQGAALTGLLAGVAANSYAKFGPLLPSPWYPFSIAIAWPWYALIGSTTVVAVGLVVGRLTAGPAPAVAEMAA